MNGNTNIDNIEIGGLYKWMNNTHCVFCDKIINEHYSRPTRPIRAKNINFGNTIVVLKKYVYTDFTVEIKILDKYGVGILLFSKKTNVEDYLEKIS